MHDCRICESRILPFPAISFQIDGDWQSQALTIAKPIKGETHGFLSLPDPHFSLHFLLLSSLVSENAACALGLFLRHLIFSPSRLSSSLSSQLLASMVVCKKMCDVFRAAGCRGLCSRWRRKWAPRWGGDDGRSGFRGVHPTLFHPHQ